MVAKKDEPGTDIVHAEVVEAAAGIVSRESDVITRFLTKEITEETANADTVYAAMIQEILSRDNAKDILTVIDAVPLAEFVNHHLRVFGYHVNDSDYDSGAPVYVSMAVEHVTSGERYIVNTGWQAVIAQCFALKRAKAFPVDVVPVVPKKANRYGNFPIRLKMWEPTNG